MPVRLRFVAHRRGHYFFTPEVGGKVDKAHKTQVGRALAHLGVTHIAAYSPEARGRSERMFGTLQDRLIKELALAGIRDMPTANAWIKADFLPRHNAGSWCRRHCPRRPSLPSKQNA